MKRLALLLILLVTIAHAHTTPLAFAPEIPVGRRAILTALANTYLPQIHSALGVSPNLTPIHITFAPEPAQYPGATYGRKIELSASYMHRHPDDAGMILHEFVHVVQAYPEGPTPGWITEGIADYLRDYILLPEPTRHTPPAIADYHRGYTHAATLLDYIIQTRHHGDWQALIHPLNAACQRGENGEAWLTAHYGTPDAIADEMKRAATPVP